MGSRSSGALARAEMIAIAGPEALNPPIDNPHDPRWDDLLGSERVDFFKGFVSGATGVEDPAKELAAVGINTPRDMAIVGIDHLMRLPGLGMRSMLNCWSAMREAEPPMPLPFTPDISSVVKLSLGELNRVPIVAATQRWLPPLAYRKHGDISVARGYEMINAAGAAYRCPQRREASS